MTAAGGTIEPDLMLRQSPRVVFRKLAEGSGGVLLHLDTAAYHGLNEFGAVIWSSLQEGVCFRSLLQDLRAELDEVPPSFEQDLAEFVTALSDRGLVESYRNDTLP